MSADESRPTLSVVEDRYELARQHWAAWRANAQLDVDFYFRGVPEDGPRGFTLRSEDGKLRYHEIRPSVVKESVQRMATRLFANEPVFRVERPMGLEEEEATARMEREADYAEAAAHAVMHHSTRRNGVGSFNNEVAKQVGLTGMAIIACWYDESENPRPVGESRRSKTYRDWLAKREYSFPIMWEYWWPLDVYPSPDDGRSWVVRVQKRTGWEILRRYPDWRPEGAGNDPKWRDTYYDFALYCDEKWYWYGLLGETKKPAGRGGQELDAVEHSWGRVPIRLIASGFGIDDGKPEHRYVGVCRWAIEGGLVTALARNASQRDAINSSMAWPTVLYPASWVQGDGGIDFSPGKDNPIQVDDPNEIQAGLRIVQGTTVPQGIYSEGQELRAEFYASTVPEEIGSGEAAASDPTSKYIRRLAEAGTIINQAKQNVEEGYEDLMGMVLRALKSDEYFGKDEHFMVRTRLHGKSRMVRIDKDKLPDNPILKCVLDPERQYEKSARLQIGLELVKAGKLDDQTFQEDFAGRDDGGEGIRRRKRRERLSEVVEQVLTEYVTGRVTGKVGPETSFPALVAQRMGQQGQSGQGQDVDQMAAQGVMAEPGAPVEQPGPAEMGGDMMPSQGALP